MRRAGALVVLLTLTGFARASVNGEHPAAPPPAPAVAGEQPADGEEGEPPARSPEADPTFANIVVDRASEDSGKSLQHDAQALTERDSEDAIELMDVHEVVAIPKSAQQSMIPKEDQIKDKIIVGVESDGKLVKQGVGTETVVYVSKDRDLFQGMEDVVEIDGQTITKPILLVTTQVRGKLSRERYPLAFKTVKSGQSRIEAGMQVRGGVRAVVEGVSPGTLDVYLEIALPGMEEKKILVCGTFDMDETPAVRNAASQSEGGKPPK